MNSKLQRDAYQKNINEVFKKQIQYITGDSNVPDYSDESDIEDLDDAYYEKKENNIIELDEDEIKKRNALLFRNEQANADAKKKKKVVVKR
jgi:hypothetical protein